MTPAMRTEEYVVELVQELCKQPKETEWIEFKHNNESPEEIGEYISALSNAAALHGKVSAYVVWGMDDSSHNIIGTEFDPGKKKKGNEELENWLLRLLEPKIEFQFHKVEANDRPVVVLEIGCAFRHPVRFSGTEYIRVGSYKKKLKDYPEKERALWRIFDSTPFEAFVAKERASDNEVLKLLDYPAYFDLLEQPLPDRKQNIIEIFEQDRLIRRNIVGSWDITNLGAILFARKLDLFPQLKRKSVRVIQYHDNDRVRASKETEGNKGYACGFEGLIAHINGLLPSNEVMGEALRKTVPMFPELAVRELVVNALVHQDFFETGSGPMVEIFTDRIEITNPGKPLVETNRFLDSPPKSRNESLASLMRRMRICEERGSGIDKVVFQVELYQLPAPIFRATDTSTQSILFAHKDPNEMDRDDRIRACYLHACLKYVTHSFLTNESLRGRFGIAEKNSAMASRYIKEAVLAQAIVPADPNASKKYMKYVPFWATEDA